MARAAFLAIASTGVNQARYWIECTYARVTRGSFELIKHEDKPERRIKQEGASLGASIL
jgi:hypothetical protein